MYYYELNLMILIVNFNGVYVYYFKDKNFKICYEILDLGIV